MALVSKKPNTGVSNGYIQWNPNPAVIIEPSAPEKLTGWAPEQYPPSQNFNWFWNIVSTWTNFFAGSNEDYYVISSNSKEADYATFQSAVAAGLTDGDKLLIKTDQTINIATATVIINKAIKIKVLKGIKINVTGAWGGQDVLDLSSNNITIEGDLVFNITATGTIGKLVKLNGNNIYFNNIVANNTSTAVIAVGFNIETGIAAVYGEGVTTNTGAGSFTSVLTDGSGLLTNLVRIREI